jgi:uncharacterized delta-60 repeat protein
MLSRRFLDVERNVRKSPPGVASGRHRFRALPRLETLEDRTLLSNGLDPSFDGDGKQTVAFDLGGANGTNFDYATAVARQADGKIVLAGGADRGVNSFDFALARLNANGALDTGFGVGGKSTFGFGPNDAATGVVVQPDGKIVVCGFTDFAGNDDFVVARLKANGFSDTGFGDGGAKIIPFDSGGLKRDIAVGLALQADGKIVVAGSIEASLGNYDFGVTRLNADGSLDTGFGVGGRSSFGFGNNDGASGVALQPDGKIVVVGYTDFGGTYDFVAARLNANGFSDTGFGNGGAKIIPFDVGGTKTDSALAVALQTDGKIVLAGNVAVASGNTDFGVARLNANGTLDTGFGVGGKSTFGFAPNDGAAGVAVQPDGKIVVAGSTDPTGTDDMVVARLKSNGFSDPGFGNGGKQIIPFDLDGPRNDVGLTMMLQPDGKIVVAGYAELANATGDFAVARLLGNFGAIGGVAVAHHPPVPGSGPGAVAATDPAESNSGPVCGEGAVDVSWCTTGTHRTAGRRHVTGTVETWEGVGLVEDRRLLDEPFSG